MSGRRGPRTGGWGGGKKGPGKMGGSRQEGGVVAFTTGLLLADELGNGGKPALLRDGGGCWVN